MDSFNLKVFQVVLLSVLLFSFCSCATIMTSSHQKVTLRSNVDEAAIIKVGDETYRDVKFPHKVKVRKSSGSVTVSGESENYIADKLQITKRIDAVPVFVGNIFIGGIIGMGVDFISGKAFKVSKKDYFLNFELKEDSPLLARNKPATPPLYTSPATDKPTPTLLLSDVDENIPVSKTKNNRTFVTIIANENYKTESNVPYALNDGKIFKEYCIKTLGIPEENIDLFEDATYNEIRRSIHNARQFANAFGKKSNIIFFYAGHGIADESNRNTVLLPVDGYGSDSGTGYKTDELYTAFGELEVASVTVFMDACFSGTVRTGDMMTSARGIAIRPKEGMPQGNTILFSASKGDETAYCYNDKGHGMFSYFLFKKLQESKGDVTYKELFEYIESKVKETSFITNRKIQTPTVKVASSLRNEWEKIKFK